MLHLLYNVFHSPAVLVTITMGEFKRRAKQVTKAGSATATAVVGAIGQRVQDTASFYAINAAIQHKQTEHVLKRKLHLQTHDHAAHDSPAGGVQGLTAAELTSSSEPADRKSITTGVRTEYVDKMAEVRLA